MGVCNVSLIISNKNPCKMFSNNSSKNYGSSYAEGIMNIAPLTFPVSPWENWVIFPTKKKFSQILQIKQSGFCMLQSHEILSFWRCGVLIYFVLQTAAKITWFKS